MALSISRILPPLLAAAVLAGCGRSDQPVRMAEAEAAKTPHERSVTAAPPAAAPSAADFVAKVSAGDLFEVQSGQLAERRAADARVKAFAANLVRDHTRSSQDLKTAVAESGYSIGVGQAVTPDLQAALNGLAAAQPADFDRAFMQAQVKAHEQALALLQRYAQDGDVPSLKAYAGEAAGVVQHHLKDARDLAGQLG
jgi:putative membrane protein